MSAGKDRKNLETMVDDLGPLVYRAEQLSSFCLVVNNALEDGSTNETQYIPAIELMGELMAEFSQQLATQYEQIHSNLLIKARRGILRALL